MAVQVANAEASIVMVAYSVQVPKWADVGAGPALLL
jgi:hypothetical protein